MNIAYTISKVERTITCCGILVKFTLHSIIKRLPHVKEDTLKTLNRKVAGTEKGVAMLNGRDIEYIQTIRNDNGFIAVWTGKEQLRLPITTIAQMLSDYYFRLEKKQKHYWLVDAIKKEAVGFQTFS